MGDFVEKLLKRNFRAILRSKTCKAILALPIAKAAPDPHNDPRELGKPLHYASLLAVQEHNKNKFAGVPGQVCQTVKVGVLDEGGGRHRHSRSIKLHDIGCAFPVP
jgi:hypothetical protein